MFNNKQKSGKNKVLFELGFGIVSLVIWIILINTAGIRHLGSWFFWLGLILLISAGYDAIKDTRVKLGQKRHKRDD